MIFLLKKSIQWISNRYGYRIVPKARDPKSLLDYISSTKITTVIDVGANTGQTCVEWMSLFPNAKIHAIEALEQFKPHLERLTKSNPARLQYWQYAATDKSGEVKFYVHSEHPSSSSLLSSTSNSHKELPFTKSTREITVQGIRLDELFDEKKVSPDERIFLKLDVQGAELSVLRGCSGLLKHVQAIQCEVNLTPLYEGQPRFDELLDFLSKYGLIFCGITEQFHTKQGKAIFLDAIFKRSDF